MTVEVMAPAEFQSQVIGSPNTLCGTIIDNEVRNDEFAMTIEVALNNMFGYSNQLRAIQGKGEFSMEFKNRQPVLSDLQKQLEEAHRKTLTSVKSRQEYHGAIDHDA